MNYEYKAEVVRVVDGDTVVLDIDLGFSMIVAGEHCRLAGIDAPEKVGASKADGLAAKTHLESLIAEQSDENSTVLIRSHKNRRGKFGRYLVDLLTLDGKNINRMMVDDGFAENYVG